MDEEILKLYDLREKAINEEESKFTGAKEEGKRRTSRRSYLVAKNMLNAGMDIHTIKKVTGLKAEEIIALQNNVFNNNGF